MKNLMWIRLSLIAMTMAFVAWAADVNGKWRAEFSTPDGSQRVNTFTFKVDGDSVTGTVSGGQDDTAIKDGKISGDAISFVAERPFGTFTYKGKITGEEIKFSVQFNDSNFDMTAKRMK